MADSSIAIRWSAPSTCPSTDVVRRRVVELAAPETALDAETVVTESEGRFRGVLRVRSGPAVGERVLDETSCERLAESAAVILAMSATPPEVAPPSPPTSPDPVAAPPRVSPLPPAVPAADAIVRIRAHASLDVGTLPAPAIGGGIAVTLTPNRHVAIGLAGSVWADQTATPLANQGATFRLLTGDATACYGVHLGAFEVAPCAVVELAHIAATGVRESATASPTATWLALGAGALIRWEVTRHFAMLAELDAVVPTASQSFVIAPHGTVHTIGAVAGRGYFGPEVRF